MKKYLFGLAAIVFALGIVAFTSPATGKRTTVVMYYQAPGGNPFTEASVETQNYWRDVAITCIAGTDKACKFTIDQSYTKLIGGIQRALKSPADGAPYLTISAELGSGGSNYRIPTSHANVSSVVNKN